MNPNSKVDCDHDEKADSAGHAGSATRRQACEEDFKQAIFCWN